MDALVVLTACEREEEGERIARLLVAEGLAACVHLLPAGRSFYVWEGALREAAEWTLVIKTRAALYDLLEERIRSLHSYEVPEILALPVARGLPAYLTWLFANTER